MFLTWHIFPGQENPNLFYLNLLAPHIIKTLEPETTFLCNWFPKEGDPFSLRQRTDKTSTKGQNFHQRMGWFCDGFIHCHWQQMYAWVHYDVFTKILMIGNHDCYVNVFIKHFFFCIWNIKYIYSFWHLSIGWHYILRHARGHHKKRLGGRCCPEKVICLHLP